jgi:SWI/SNF-related matrix-associated actin-dependent regulator 1 of chromatin subfamily A
LDRNRACFGVKAERVSALPVPAGLSYLPFQDESIRFALARKNTLFGDDMGLGKTIQAIGTVNALPSAETILVLCPRSLAENWRRELSRWLVRKRPIAIAQKSIPEEADVVILSYASLGKHLSALLRRTWDIAILDEVHYLKNQSARRSRLTARLITRVKRILALTGTPVPNRPQELFSLVKMLDPDGWPELSLDFGRKYADAKEIYFRLPPKKPGDPPRIVKKWDLSGASNLEELGRRLRASCMIRREKKDVLRDLPPKSRHIVELSAPGSENLVQAELRAFQDSFDPRGQEGTPEEYERAVARLETLGKARFTEIARLRHEVAMAKVPAVLRHVRGVLAHAEKVVVFGHHLDMIAELRASLRDFRPVVLTGENSLDERQRAVDRFQVDPKCRVFLGGLAAAGLGFSLTAASYVVFAELDWTPGVVLQAEDRCWRLGQRDPVTVEHLVLTNSLDARMAKIIVKKQNVTDEILQERPDASRKTPLSERAPSA